MSGYLFGFYSLVMIVSLICAPANTAANSNDIMSCVLCEMVAESVLETKPTNPASALTTMYKRCAQMGLMEPVCDQLVDENARSILRMVSTGTEPRFVCRELNLCDH